MAIAWDGGLVCSLDVKDMKASIEWYGNTLGWKPDYVLEDMGWAELSTGVARVSIGLSQVEQTKGTGGASLVFGVNDIDAARAELESKDVRFDGPTRTIPEMVRLATFFDPDGNCFMLYQSLSKS